MFYFRHVLNQNYTKNILNKVTSIIKGMIKIMNKNYNYNYFTLKIWKLHFKKTDLNSNKVHNVVKKLSLLTEGKKIARD